MTRPGRRLTLRGVKPICPFQHRFEFAYLFGAFSPLDGDSLLIEMPFCNATAFQIFLDEFSKQKPEQLKVIFLDNGAFHKAGKLQIPKNIILIFLPPYSPELNPAEKIWWTLKKEITMKNYKTMDEMMTDMVRIIKSTLTIKKIIKLTSYKIFLSAYRTIIYV